MKRRSIIFKISLTIVSTVILSYAISFILEKVNILEKFTIAITDIDFSDIYYQYRQTPRRDNNIVIVNIGYLDRSALARLVKTISDNNPKVIAADVFFSAENDSITIEGTHELSNQLKEIKNLVVASSHQQTEDGQDFIAGQSPLIKKHVKEGIVSLNIATDDPEYGTVRSFEPISDINGVKHLSFGFSVGAMWDSTVLTHVNEGEMMIKWYGYGYRNTLGDTSSIFKTLDWHQIQTGDFNKADIENKIVLLGFLGDQIGVYSATDQFYSPLNKKIIGRSLPDMYGVEIHANIIKMIIDKDFIRHSRTTDFFFNLLFLTSLAVTVLWIHRKYEKQYSILSKIVLVLYIDLLVLGTISIFLVSGGGVKFLIGDGLFVMVFLPDVYEFLEINFFRRLKKEPDRVPEAEELTAENTPML
jgi:CHASE2 domain-containing sensor protein